MFDMINYQVAVPGNYRRKEFFVKAEEAQTSELVCDNFRRKKYIHFLLQYLP